MAILHKLVSTLLCVTICVGERVPRNIRRQDAPTTTTICGDLIDSVNQGESFHTGSQEEERELLTLIR